MSSVETALKERFADTVEGLSLESVARLEPGRKRPKGLAKYALTPLVSKFRDDHSSYSCGRNIEIPEGVETYYRGEGADGRPFLDCGFAIGLTYRNRLGALAAAHATDRESLKIIQLQGVYDPTGKAGKDYKSGLYGGFLWRDSLVQAWIELAGQFDAGSVEIQSAENNRWWGVNAEAYSTGYDGVAARMGFRQASEVGGDWIFDL